MYIIILLIIAAYVLTGLAKNIIDIYNFFKQDNSVTETKKKLTETSYNKK